MKTICAWCRELTQITCDHCHAQLIHAHEAGEAFAQDSGAMVCTEGETPILYSEAAIEAMQISHGICRACLALTEEDRANLIAQKRGPTGVSRAPTNTRHIDDKIGDTP